MNKITASEAKVRFGDLLDRVVAGEQVAITRNGREIAVIVSACEFRRTALQAPASVAEPMARWRGLATPDEIDEAFADRNPAWYRHETES